MQAKRKRSPTPNELEPTNKKAKLPMLYFYPVQPDFGGATKSVEVVFTQFGVPKQFLLPIV